MNLVHRLRDRFTRHRLAGTSIGVLVVTVLIFAAASLAPATSASAETAAITGQLNAAIRSDFEQGMMDQGISPAHLSGTARAALAKKLQDQGLPAFSKAFTGQALADRVSNHMVWANEATSGSTPIILAYQIKAFSPDEPVVAGDTATVTGTYVVHFKNGQDAPKGMVTWGGTSTQAFTAMLARVGGRWLVSTYAERQVAETDNQEDYSGWENLPSPSPKTEPATFIPAPVKP